MKKVLTAVLSMVVALSLGVAFIHCNGDGDDCECPAEQICGNHTNPNCAGVICGTCPAGKFCMDFGTKCEDCEPECGDRVCGPDPKCSSSCGTCDTGFECDANGQCQEVCVPDCGDRECGMDPVCGTESCGECTDAETCCDDATGTCVGPQCGDLECGPDPLCGLECGPCDDPLVCHEDQLCVEECCPGQDLHAFVEAGPGGALAFPPTTITPIEVALAGVAGMDALTNPNPTHLAETTSAADGSYKTPCMDLTTTALGVLMLSDDAGFDGTGGVWFPTYSGVMAIDDNEDKVCSYAHDTPPIFGVANTLVTALSAFPGMEDISTDGFAIVLITDNDLTPLEGALLKKVDGTDVPGTIYPNATLDGLGASTAAHGIALVPGPLALTFVIGEKDGYTWSEDGEAMAVVSGFCLTRPVSALAAP
jgi:hypothetical protein